MNVEYDWLEYTFLYSILMYLQNSFFVKIQTVCSSYDLSIILLSLPNFLAIQGILYATHYLSLLPNI